MSGKSLKVLIVGGGAREHALAWKLAQSPVLGELIAAPGNPGIASIARCLPIPATDTLALVDLSVGEAVDLVVVGPEDPLASGLVDRLQEKGVRTFGPSRAASRLESSKTFAKDLMRKYGIPTARYEAISSLDEGLAALKRWGTPVVIKADGLARGRGVTVARTPEEAEGAIRQCMVDRVFGDHGDTLVLEEFLEGEELSLIGLSDGTRVVSLQPAQDHKQLLDGDRGPNTGGMGCISPVPGVFNVSDLAAAVLQGVADAMRAEGAEFRGALFAGLMMTAGGPRVLEFNVRFGDPEAETLLPRMKSDLLPLLLASADGKLEGHSVEWTDRSAVCVVLASRGYPGTFATGKPIHGLESFAPDDREVVAFHAGTAEKPGMAGNSGEIVTAGGRVIAVTALGDSLDGAITRAYEAAGRISFEGLYRRTDIGRRHILETRTKDGGRKAEDGV